MTCDKGPALSVDLPPELCGTVQLCAYRFQGDHITGGRTRIVYVYPPSELKITTTLDRDEYRPGSAAKINFRVTDAKGGAAPGVLSIAAVDEAVFAVLPQRPGRKCTSTRWTTPCSRRVQAPVRGRRRCRPWTTQRHDCNRRSFAAAGSTDSNRSSRAAADDEARLSWRIR